MSDPDKTKLPKEIIQSLKAMDQATDLMDKVLRVETAGGTMANAEVAKIKKLRQKPTWKLRSVNRIEGLLDEQPFKVVVKIDFNLDTQTLQDQIDKMKTTDTSEVKKAAAHLSTQPQGDELAQVLEAAYEPQSLGISTAIEVVEIIGAKAEVKLNEGVMVMAVDTDLVHCQWAELLNRWLPDPVFLNAQQFSEACWVNWEFLQGKESFKKDFAWEVAAKGQLLQIKIETEWERL